MENTSVTPETATPEAPEAANETLVGKPKESVATAPEVEEAPIVPVAKRKIKWGDTEREVTIDEAVKLAEKAFGIEAKAKEANDKAQSAQGILDMLANNPREFAKRCRAQGLDPQKLATEILYEQIELNSLTPEQRELRELKAKEAEAEAERKTKDEETKKLDMDKKTQAWASKFENELKTALEKKQLPMSRLTLALAAQYIDAGLAQKKDYSVEQVLPYVMRDLKNIHMSTLGSLEGDQLLAYIGDDISNKIAKARVDRYKKGTTTPPVVAKTVETGSLPKDITKLKGKAYWKAVRQMKSEQGIEAFPGNEE